MIEFLYKEVKRLRWRSKRWVITILLLEFLIIVGHPSIQFKYIYFVLPLTYIVWLLINNYDLLFNYHKIAIVLEADKDNVQAISKARQIVDKIELHFNSSKAYSRLIKIYPLDVNRLRNIEQASDYLEKWWNKFDSIILAEIDYGRNENKETFLVKKFSIISKHLKQDVTLSGVKINLAKELNLIVASTRLYYLTENELVEKELLIAGIKRLLLFYSGLCLLGQARLDDALVIFKSIFNRANTILRDFDIQSPPKQLNLKPEQIFDGRLKVILSHVYGQLIDPIRFKGADEKKLKLLTDAVATLTPAPIVFAIKVLLARTYYELGNRKMAEQTTEEIYEEFGLKEEVLINRGFFAILNKNSNKVLKNYQTLGLPRVDGISIVAFLHEEKEKYPECKLLFEFAIAITTTIYQDRSEGKVLLKEFIGKTAAIHGYKSLRNHCIKLLRNG